MMMGSNEFGQSVTLAVVPVSAVKARSYCLSISCCFLLNQTNLHRRFGWLSSSGDVSQDKEPVLRVCVGDVAFTTIINVQNAAIWISAGFIAKRGGGFSFIVLTMNYGPYHIRRKKMKASNSNQDKKKRSGYKI